MAAVRIIKLIIKLLLFIILLPVIIIWFLYKSLLFKFILRKNLLKCGMPSKDAKKLLKELSLCKIFRLKKLATI